MFSNRIFRHIAAISTVMIVGTLIFSLLERMNLLESFYFVGMIITLVGSNIEPKTALGVLFSVILAFTSAGIIISMVNQIFIPHLASNILRSRYRHKVSRMENHIILTGDSNTTFALLGKLDRKTTFVLTEDQRTFENATRKGFATLLGDPASMENLSEAGVRKCSLLIAASKNDAENAFTTLTAKRMNTKARVVARITKEENRSKLLEVGADVVICPPTLAIDRIIEEVKVLQHASKQDH